MKRLLTLFREMFLLAACVIGGGYVILSVADGRFSKRLRWIRPGELFEMLPVFQMIPGIIGGHVAVYVGRRVAGLAGALVALAGMILPSLIVFIGIALVYRAIPVEAPVLAFVFFVLRVVLTVILAIVTAKAWRRSVAGVYGYAAVLLATLAMAVFGISPARVILVGMLAGLALEYVRTVRERPGTGRRVYRSFWAIPLLFVGYGLMAFGGGFVLIPAFLRDFVGPSAPYLKLASADFANVIALTEMTPGPVAANCATFFGYALGGVAGAVVATVSLVLPGAVVLWGALGSIERFRTHLVVRGIFRGVRPVTVALLLSATLSLARTAFWQATHERNKCYNTEIMTLTRRQAREWAIQMLTAADLNPPQDVSAFIASFWAQLPTLEAADGGLGEGETASGKIRLFAEERVSGVLGDLTAIDAEIEPLLEHWDLYRLGTVERAVLRMGVWELRATDVPPGVVINEAIDLVNWFSSPKSRMLVNAVLDKYAKGRGECHES